MKMQKNDAQKETLFSTDQKSWIKYSTGFVDFPKIGASSPSFRSQGSFDPSEDVNSSIPQVRGHQSVSVEPPFDSLGRVPLPQRER
jgi:hypothetical protein